MEEQRFFEETTADVATAIHQLMVEYYSTLAKSSEPCITLVQASVKKVGYNEEMGCVELSHRKPTPCRMLSRNGAKTHAQVLAVLATCYKLLKSGRTATQREIYYVHKALFASASESNAIILRLCAKFGVPRHLLGIVASSRGKFAGCVEIQEHGEWVKYQGRSCTTITSTALDTVLHFRSPARCVVVVEKDCIFQRLVEDKLFDKFPCIIVTGCGYPDLATRAFVRQLQDGLRIPVVGLCDWNPFGMDLLLCYKVGSASAGLDPAGYAVDLKWLGLHSQDFDRFAIAKSSFLPLGAADRKKIESLRSHPFVKEHPLYLDELEAMVLHNSKAELESVHCHGLHFFSEVFVIEKILSGSFF